MKRFRNLTQGQKQSLLKFPVYVSLLATSDSKMDEKERMVAIKFAHTKAFSCHPILADFCKESELVFESNLQLIETLLPKDKEERDAAIRKELLNLEKFLPKLGKVFTFTLQASMKTFQEHVSKAHHSVFQDFILPISIPGLTD